MSPSEVIVKLGLGAGAGFALYMLIRNLRLGGGFGFGGDHDDRGEVPAPAPPLPVPPTIAHDDQPLLFWVSNPEGFSRRSSLSDPTSRARLDARFRLIDLGTAELSAGDLHKRVSEVLRRDWGTPAMTFDDVVTRIKAGGRDDVRLMSSGGILQGTWDDAKDALMGVGIKHWLLWEEFPADRKPGQAPKPPRWDLFDKTMAVDNPDRAGHYRVDNRGTAYWNLERSASHVSGIGSFDARGAYRSRRASSGVGRGYYRGYGR